MPQSSSGTVLPNPTPEAQAHAQDLGAFVTSSPSSYHAVQSSAARLRDAQYHQFQESEPWQIEAGGKYFVIRDGAIIAFALPEAVSPTTGYRILGAHTDSPSFKLKPNPDFTAAGWAQENVEIYGGPLLNSWLDRELRFAGRIVTSDGVPHLVSTGPVARIPQLAIHLDRQVNDGLKLDKQLQVQPIVGTAGNGGIVDELAQLAGVEPEAVVGADVVVADTQEPRLFGLHQEFLASGRLDNLSSVHAGVLALLETEPGQHINVLAAFDHEEIGSSSRSGASGPFLEDVLVRIGAALGATPEGYLQSLANSWCLSADASHLAHPNYQGHHDPVNKPVPGAGVLLKTNANQRYATDAVGAAEVSRAAAQAGVPLQEFVSNNQVPSGTTIGTLTATRLGIRTVDLGVGLLSMHSAREMCHVEDLYGLRQLIGAFFQPTQA